MKIIGTINRFATSGKSLIAQELAEKTVYTHIDSRATYRTDKTHPVKDAIG